MSVSKRPQRIVSNLSVNVIIHLEVKLNCHQILKNTCLPKVSVYILTVASHILDNISIFSFNTHKKHTLSEQKFVQQRVRLYQRFGTKYLIVTSSWAFMSVSVIMCQNLHICWGFQLLHLCTTYSPRPFLFPKCQNFARGYVWIGSSN